MLFNLLFNFNIIFRSSVQLLLLRISLLSNIGILCLLASDFSTLSCYLSFLLLFFYLPFLYQSTPLNPMSLVLLILSLFSKPFLFLWQLLQILIFSLCFHVIFFCRLGDCISSFISTFICAHVAVRGCKYLLHSKSLFLRILV